jgi:tetratricopeptide (TPR) repeat protein
MTETEPPAEKARLDAAEALRQSGRLEEAEAAFLAVLRRKPGNLPAALGAGRCALKRGALPRATELLSLAAEKGKYPWPLLELGAECRRIGHFDEAEAAYRHAMQLAPDTPEPILGLAACARRRGLRELALERQSAACALAPGNITARMELGRDLQKLDRFDEAAAVFAAVLDDSPNDPKALEAAAAVARKTGDRDRSMQLLKQAVAGPPGAALHAADTPDRVPRGSSAWMKIGMLERTNGNAAAAAAAFEQAHAAEPGNAKIIRQLVREHRGLGNRERAETLQVLADRIDPDGAGKPSRSSSAARPTAETGPAAAASIRLLLDRAKDLRTAGELAEAAGLYRQAAGLAPGAAEPLAGLAACARKQGDRAAALEHQRAAAALSPGDAAIGVQLGKDLLKLQRLEEAAAVFDAVLAAHPGHLAASKAAAFVARKRGDADRAAGLLHEAAVALDRAAGSSSSAQLWLKLAALERTRERHDAAVRALERAHAADPQDVGIIWSLAREYRGLGERARSDELIRRAARLDPGAKQAPSRSARRVMLALLAADARHAQPARKADSGPAGRLLARAATLRGADGDRAAAYEVQRQACDLAPDDLSARVQLGKDLQELGRLDEAAVIFDSVLADSPEHAAALKAAASLARRTGDKQRAITLLKQVAELDADQPVAGSDPANAAVWLRIGALERSSGRYEAAVAAFERAHEADPANVDIIRQLAREHRVLGNQARCNALLDLAARLDPESRAEQPSISNEPKRMVTGGRRDRARDAELAPVAKRLARKQRIGTSRAAAQALANNDAERALDLFRSGIAKNASKLSLYLGACTALMRLGRIDEAAAILDQAGVKCGHSASLYARRAQLLRDTGRIHEALQVARDGHAAHPDSFLLWDSVMRLFTMIGSDAQVAAWRAQAPARTPDEQAGVAVCAGDAAESAGDPASAAAFYATAAALQPGQPAHHAARTRTALALFDIPGAIAHLQAETRAQEAARPASARGTGAPKSYFDHVINEYRLEPGALDRVAVLPRDPQVRAAELFTLWRDHPDNTLVAAALADALWRSGELSARGTDAAPIPKRIVQYWAAGEPPGEVRPLMESWQAVNPGFDYTRFDDRAARAFLARTCNQDVLFAYHRALVPSLKSDVFRLAYLAREGGIYVDADDRCIEPVERLLPAGARLVLCREGLGMLDNSLLAAVPEHPVILLALDQAAASINRGDRDSIRLSTGPGLLTRSVAQVLAQHAADETGEPESLGIHVWTERAVQRVVAMRCGAAFRAMLPYRSRTAIKRGRGSDPSGADAAELDTDADALQQWEPG